MSSDLKATNESARCWEKNSSYIKRADMFFSLFKPQLSTFEGHFCAFLLCFWGDNTVHVPHILAKGILSCECDILKIFTWKHFFYMRLLLKTILFLSPSPCKHFFLLSNELFCCLQPLHAANNLFQNFPTPHPHPVQKIMVRP